MNYQKVSFYCDGMIATMSYALSSMSGFRFGVFLGCYVMFEVSLVHYNRPQVDIVQCGRGWAGI